MFDQKENTGAPSTTALLYAAVASLLASALLVAATCVDVLSREGTLTFSAFLNAHRHNPVPWLIDVVVVLTGIVAGFLGSALHRVVRRRRELERGVSEHPCGLLDLDRRLEQKITEQSRTEAELETARLKTDGLIDDLERANKSLEEAVHRVQQLSARVASANRGTRQFATDTDRNLGTPSIVIPGPTDNEQIDGYDGGRTADSSVQTLLTSIGDFLDSSAANAGEMEREDADSRRGDSRAGPGAQELISRSPMRILITDDDVVSQIVVSRMLRRDKHTLAFGEDGKEAIGLLEQRSFDLIFMGIHLPDMSGLEATGIIRQRERRGGGYTPIIGLVSEDEREEGQRGVESGMDDLLYKPVDRRSLYEVIDRVMGKSRSTGRVPPPTVSPEPVALNYRENPAVR